MINFRVDAVDLMHGIHSISINSGRTLNLDRYTKWNDYYSESYNKTVYDRMLPYM